MTSATIEDAEIIERPLSYEEERGKPTPSKNHSFVQSKLIGEFAKHLEFHVHSELTLDIDGKRFTPDLSLYPSTDVIDLENDVDRPSEPPLLAVEIFSPHQGVQAVLDKVSAYFAHGVRSCWIVAPALHYIDIRTPDGKVRRYTEGVATDPVLGVTADLAAVFPARR